VVINEVDYDQVSTDTAEFFELKNVSASAIDLDAYVVELVNGNAGGALIYDTINLPDVSVPAGDYFVVCANATTVVNCDLVHAPATNSIQNGGPDAVGLRNGATLVDALSYEGDSGAPYTEGSGTGLEDDPAGTNGLSRCPDGIDTDVNNVDFRYASSTPGTANDCPSPPTAVEIAEIQGASHASPLVGQSVQTTGIVTALRFSGGNGFYLQDPSADADAETSEAIFVFTSSVPTVAVGDSLEVVGTVAEFRPGGTGSTNLTTTQLSMPMISVLASGSALPTAAVIGTGSRVPPSMVIDDDAAGSVETSGIDPGDDTFGTHADYIVNHLRSPDLIAIEEIQDSDGPTNSSVTDAATTWNMLIAAIAAEGGPTYQFRQINPVDDQDGGEPGGNIRVGFLFRTDRGLEFIARPGGTPTSSTTVVDHPSGPRLSASPGRIDPANTAFNSSRKPLAGEFRMRGKKVFVIANHFNSKGGDHPLFGRFQPPVRSTEVQRHAQAQIVNDFVDDLLAADEHANVIVLGDINDFEFSETVEILEGGVLTSLMNTLPKPERYSYVFEGNSQVLDQILVSDNILNGFATQYDVVHVNSEFANQASDHDPQVARIDFRGRPRP
jgi:predicted extracellular nuclease